MSSKPIPVKILGKEYQVSCPENQTHSLIDAAFLLDEKMKKIRSSGKVIGSERIAVMAALNLAHELLCLQSSTDEGLKMLYNKIDAALTV